MFNKDFIKKLLILKSKFAASSGVATLSDIGLFKVLEHFTSIPIEVVNIISSSVGMLINFFLQNKYVFDRKRELSATFLMSAAVSVGGIFLSTTIIHLLKNIEPFLTYPILAKLTATGIVFFYNFYLKRFSFEKKFL